MENSAASFFGQMADHFGVDDEIIQPRSVAKRQGSKIKQRVPGTP